MLNRIIRLLVIIASFNSNSYASSHDFKSNTKLKANISNYGLNRISFSKFDISEVVGDQSKFQIINDASSKNIFILPRVPVGTKFEVALINNYGAAQDVEFTVKNIPGQMLLFDDNTVSSEHASISLRNIAAAQMLRAMRADVKDRYYVTGHDKKLQQTLNTKFKNKQLPLAIVKTKTYRFENLTGIILTVKTTSKTGNYHIKTADYDNLFAGTILTSMDNYATDNNSIVRKYTYPIYIVTGSNGHD